MGRPLGVAVLKLECGWPGAGILDLDSRIHQLHTKP
jgi:hypothetical protein